MDIKLQNEPYFIVNIILPKDEVSKEKIAKMIAPYDENMEVYPYIFYHKRDEAKLQREQLDHLKEILHGKDKSYNLLKLEEKYEKIKKMTAEQHYNYYFDEDSARDEEDNIICTYNPNSRWDKWRVGGYFAGWLLNMEAGKATLEIKDNCCPIEHALKERKIPFALVLSDGTWLQVFNLDPWPSINEKITLEWEKTVMDTYSKYPGYVIVQIECFI